MPASMMRQQRAPEDRALQSWTTTTRIGQCRELSWLSQLADDKTESVWKSLTDERLVAEGEALFESADKQGRGAIDVTRLREALLNCKWCVFSQKRVKELLEHLGPCCDEDDAEVSREEFSTAFVEYVKWLIKTCQASSQDNDVTARRSSSSGSSSVISQRPPTPHCSGVAAARFVAAKKGDADDGTQTYSINLAQKLGVPRRGCKTPLTSSSQQQNKLKMRSQPSSSRSLLGSSLGAESGPSGSRGGRRRASVTEDGLTPSAASRSPLRAIGGGSRAASSGAPARLPQSDNFCSGIPAIDSDIFLQQRRRNSETDARLDERKRAVTKPGALLPSLHSRHSPSQSFTLGTGASSPMKPVTKDSPWAGINLPSGKSSSAARPPKPAPRKSSSQSSDEMIVAHQDMRPGKGAAMVRLEQQHVTREQMRAFKGMPVEVDGTVRIQDFEKHLGKRAPRLVERAKKHYEASARRCSRKPAVVRGLDLEKLLPRLFPDASKAEIKAIIDIVIRPSSSKFPCSALKKTTDSAMPRSDPLVAEALAVFQYLTKSQKEHQCLAYEQCEQGLQMTGMGSEELECSLEELFCEHEDGTIWKETICLEEFTRWFTSSAGNGNLLADSQ